MSEVLAGINGLFPKLFAGPSEEVLSPIAAWEGRGWTGSLGNLLHVLLVHLLCLLSMCSPAKGRGGASQCYPARNAFPVFANRCFYPGDAETRTSPGERNATSARLRNQKGFFHPLSPLQVCVVKASRQGRRHLLPGKRLSPTLPSSSRASLGLSSAPPFPKAPLPPHYLLTSPVSPGPGGEAEVLLPLGVPNSSGTFSRFWCRSWTCRVQRGRVWRAGGAGSPLASL